MKSTKQNIKDIILTTCAAIWIIGTIYAVHTLEQYKSKIISRREIHKSYINRKIIFYTDTLTIINYNPDTKQYLLSNIIYIPASSLSSYQLLK